MGMNMGAGFHNTKFHLSPPIVFDLGNIFHKCTGFGGFGTILDFFATLDKKVKLAPVACVL